MRHDDSKILQLLNILEDPKSASARKRYLQLFDLNEIDDQAVYEHIEDLVFDATLMGEPVIDLRTDLVQQMLIMLKQGIRRPRGCPFRKLHPDVLMVQSSQDRNGDNGARALDCSM